jgi:hypothetical protein
MKRQRTSFIQQHSLSLAALGVVVLLIFLYSHSDPDTHVGSFYGNAIADWTGLLVTVVITKYLYEKGSAQSKAPEQKSSSPLLQRVREHSLTIFLVITGAGWVLAFQKVNPTAKWGQVVGNITSEWTQILGIVLMTKRLVEVRSKESK